MDEAQRGLRLRFFLLFFLVNEYSHPKVILRRGVDWDAPSGRGVHYRYKKRQNNILEHMWESSSAFLIFVQAAGIHCETFTAHWKYQIFFFLNFISPNQNSSAWSPKYCHLKSVEKFSRLNWIGCSNKMNSHEPQYIDIEMTHQPNTNDRCKMINIWNDVCAFAQ